MDRVVSQHGVDKGGDNMYLQGNKYFNNLSINQDGLAPINCSRMEFALWVERQHTIIFSRERDTLFISILA